LSDSFKIKSESDKLIDLEKIWGWEWWSRGGIKGKYAL